MSWMRRIALVAVLCASLPASPAWAVRRKGPTADLERQASKGDAKAQLQLADWHVQGFGSVPKDPYRAYMWAQAALLSARTKDDPDSREIAGRAGAIREQVAQALSPDDMIRAQSEASQRIEDALHGDRW